MYVITKRTRDGNLRPVHGIGHRRMRPLRTLSGLGDSCWLDSNTGARVCGGGDPTGQTNCAVTVPYYTPTSGGLDNQGKAPYAMTVYGTTLTWIPASKNKRTFNFLYHSGYNDVYQYVSGGMGGALTSNYAVVSSSGVLTWTTTPPAKNELGCSNITTATAVQTGGSNIYAVNGSYPVYTGSGASTPYVATQQTAPTATSGKSGLSNVPVWAWAAGAGVGGLILARMLGRK
ncbi:MAG: hypothetical protein CXZ00_03050 [Acidobacteria bacterium]|nr:MAG: hypothetical protein CXZ00_03050 [Acidobacteriota bacterium]